MAERKGLNVRVFRYDPACEQGPRYQTYEVPFEKGMSVTNVLQYIWEHVDPSLSFYVSCRRGRCRGCFAVINGKIKMACTTLVTGDFTIAPWPKYTVIKDLIVDVNLPKTKQTQRV